MRTHLERAWRRDPTAGAATREVKVCDPRNPRYSVARRLEAAGEFIAPRWEVLATELLVSIDWGLKTGLEPGEFPVTFCRDWSPLYIRRVGGYLYSLTLVFTVTGLAGPVAHDAHSEYR